MAAFPSMTANPPAATPRPVSQRLQRRNLGLALQEQDSFPSAKFAQIRGPGNRGQVRLVLCGRSELAVGGTSPEGAHAGLKSCRRHQARRCHGESATGGVLADQAELPGPGGGLGAVGCGELV